LNRFDFPWTSEQVLGLSQHDYHIKTSRELAFAHKWQRLGCSQTLIWGHIPVKDKPDIQTRVSLEPLQFACSCTSYQHPCNHALGLLLLYLSKAEAFQVCDVPLWARDVFSQYDFGPEVEAIESKRFLRRQAGMLDLERWLLDHISEGLESLRSKPQSFQQMADRLMDAQLNEIAKEVRGLNALTIKNPRWHEDLLAALGRLYLLVEGFKRLDELPKEHQSDIALALGWLPEVQSDVVLDRWHILGKRLESEVGRKILRLWLWGERTQRPALLVEMVHGKKLPSTKFLVGGVLEAGLQFYSGNVPLRAEIHHLEKISQPHQPVQAQSSIKEAMTHYIQCKSKNPWLKSFPLLLNNVMVDKMDEWMLRDAEGYTLPLPAKFMHGWHLQSLSAKGLWIFGDYDGMRFLPLSVWGNGRIVELHTLRGVS
jgi:hypothetical protein